MAGEGGRAIHCGGTGIAVFLSLILYPCSPNPFNPSTTLTFTLPAAAMVKLEVFNVNGREIGSGQARPLREGWFASGTHHILFDGSNLPSGIYLAKLTAGDWSQVQKLVLLK